MQGAFVHLELHTDDTAAAKAFYAELFGWNYTDVPMGDSSYVMIATPKDPGGGMQLKGMPDQPTMWLPYITVNDVRGTVAKARAAGAEVIVEYMEAPGFGAGAIMRDPTGAAFGIWKGEMADAAADGGSKPADKGGKKAPKKAGKKAGKKASKQAEPEPAPAPAPAPAPKAAEKPAGKKAGKKAAKKADAPAPAPAAKPAKPAKKAEKPAPAAKGGKKKSGKG